MPKGAQIDPANQDQPVPIFWFSLKILSQVMVFGFIKSLPNAETKYMRKNTGILTKFL